jgi:3-isopropylmalate/(R)-2-methylmalate dehydratase small subunit
MQPFRSITGIAAPLRRVNVDTDAISPGSQLLKVSVAKTGYGACLFYNWRHDEDGTENQDFVLNKAAYRGATILLAGHNFACGSSREVAVWALRDYGFRCVIAPSFGGIFYANMFKNGLLPVTIDEGDVDEIADEIEETQGARPLTVNLETSQVIGPSGKTYQFRVPEIYRRALLDGLDPISATLAFTDDIIGFQAVDRAKRSWAYFGGPSVSKASFEKGQKS